MMTLRLYNTLTRTKEEFKPLDPKNVRMYVCGPTVYDYAHIGNARPVIVFDVLFRLLRHLYGLEHVTYVRNITDIDDKINARAKEEGTPIRELTERTLRQFHEDISALGVLPPTHEPRATDSIPEMITLIEKLIASGHAYVAEGHVLFHVPSMKDYGRLSRRALDEMIAGARVDVAPYKRDPMDFVLWKPSDAETPGWDSPWGRGRPGWHIECSAMSWKLLGETFDIHGGGIDLIFPHHENEIAQSLCAFGTKQMAKIWMHNGFLQVEGQKMSKSLGNFVTMHSLLKSDTFGGRPWQGQLLRYVMLQTHYRQPIDWTVGKLKQARLELRSFASRVGDANVAGRMKAEARPGVVHEVDQGVVDTLLDDLNTPLAVTRLRAMADEPLDSQEEKIKFISALKFMGIMNEDTIPYFHDLYAEDISVARQLEHHDVYTTVERIRVALANNDTTGLETLKALVEGWGVTLSMDHLDAISISARNVAETKSLEQQVISLIESRTKARASKNWAKSDHIRDELAAMGVTLKDNKDGTTTWEVKR